MKNLFYIILLIFITSCKNKEAEKTATTATKIASVEKGEALFNENNCAACHQLNQKVVGPSLQDIAKIYKEKNGDLVSFLKEEAAPIVDPSMYETMKINLTVTKTMSDIELQSLKIYILNQAK